MQINYKINFIQQYFQKFSLHFKRTFLWLLPFYYITQKMHIFEYVCENFLEKLTFLCRETFKELLQVVIFLNMPLFHRCFSANFSILFKVFSFRFNKSLWYYSNSCMLLYTKWKMEIFDPIARVTLIPPVIVKWWATLM